jgi:hypothetical protein
MTTDSDQQLLKPDLDAPLTLVDDLTGRDPAMAAALAARLH